MRHQYIKRLFTDQEKKLRFAKAKGLAASEKEAHLHENVRITLNNVKYIIMRKKVFCLMCS